MEYALSGLWIALELICTYLFCGAFLERRKTKKVFVGILIAWIITVLYANAEMNQYIKQILTIAIWVSLSLWIYKGHVMAHFFLVALCYVFIIILDTAVVNGASLLLNISYSELIWRKLTYITVTTIDKLIAVFLAWIIYYFHSIDGVLSVNYKWLILLILFPLTSVTMLIILVLNSNNQGDLSYGSVIFSMILAVANIAILYTTTSLIKATKQRQESMLLKHQITLQTENYDSLKKNYSIQRKSTHEFKRHIQALKDLLDHGEYDTAKTYIGQIQNNRILRVFSINSNHPVFDVILNQKHQIMQEYEIKMQVQVNDLSKVTLQTDALVVLLSNLLDNAIEACQRCQADKEVYCSIIHDNDLYIAIRNTTPPVEIINGEIVTSKENTTEHGYGLPAVKYILNQIGADYTYNYQNGWFHFVAEIPIK